jgi:ABC-type amino acid transport substrate-binding protein
MRAKLSLLSIIAAIAAVVMLAPGPVAAESTWDQIKRTGKLRYGAVDYPPNWYRDKTSGKWTGFLVEMQPTSRRRSAEAAGDRRS